VARRDASDNGTDGQTDGQTDRRTDRVRRNMRPPPREEGRIIIHARKIIYRNTIKRRINIKSKQHQHTEEAKLLALINVGLTL